MDLIVELQSIVRKLDEKGIPYALCGGLAVAIHGYVRFTQDIDLLVRPEHLDKLLNAVNEIGYNLEGGVIPVGVDEAHPCDIHRISKVVGKSLATLDLIPVNALLEPAWETRETYDLQGQSLWVVSRDGLGVMKRLSRRRNDLNDLENLGIPLDEN